MIKVTVCRLGKKRTLGDYGKTFHKTFETLEEMADYHVSSRFKLLYPNITEELSEDQIDELHRLMVRKLKGGSNKTLEDDEYDLE